MLDPASSIGSPDHTQRGPARQRACMGWTLALAMIAMPFAATVARAEFVGGVERFDGTVKDTLTWGQSGNSITQNDALIFSEDFSSNPSYNTVSQTVGFGQRVSVKVQTTMNVSSVALYLTNNSGGANQHPLSHSAWWSFILSTRPTVQEIYAEIGGNFNSVEASDGYFNIVPANYTVYELEIQPLTPTSAQFTLYDAVHTVLGTHLVTNSSNPSILLTNSMHISLVTDAGGAIFDDVTIVPEPASLALCAGGACVLGRRRHQRVLGSL